MNSNLSVLSVYSIIFAHPLALRRILVLFVLASCIEFFMRTLCIAKNDILVNASRNSFSDLNFVRYSSSRFIEEKNDSITALSYGT